MMNNNYDDYIKNETKKEKKSMSNDQICSMIFEGILCLAAFGVSKLLGLVVLFVMFKKHGWINL